MVSGDTSSCYVTLDSMQDFRDVEKATTVLSIDIMRDKFNEYVSALMLLEAESAGTYRRVGFSIMKRSISSLLNGRLLLSSETSVSAVAGLFVTRHQQRDIKPDMSRLPHPGLDRPRILATLLKG